ncbi:MAG TPA: DinB family protein [Pyrinomonadaceae bacterium]|nr:DinB family protein [Pyrinomonadaceae bacterium]
MKRGYLTFLSLIILTSGGLSPIFGQSKPAPTGSAFRSELVRQLKDAENKLVALAEAMPQEKYSWRPGEGVRSVSEVFMHVAAGNFLIPESAGIKAPAGLEANLDKISEKAKVVDLLKRSFQHDRQAFESTTDADLDKTIKLFGSETTVRDLFLRLVTHAHEHLGQSIAYARMNNITPPWTAARQQQQRSNPR